jgi:large subunit ribosomal protein L24
MAITNKKSSGEVQPVHVRRGDMVVVTKGRERGKRGKVKRVVEKGRIEVEKVMMIKRHTKPTQKNPHGGIIDQEGSIPAANVALWCEKCAGGRRARTVVEESGQKNRVCVKCGSPFPSPGM